METNVKAKKQEAKHNEKHRTTNGEDIKLVQVEGVEVKKEPKISVSYTLKACKNNNAKLLKGKVITEEQFNTLEEIRVEATKKFIAQQYGL